MKSERSGSKGEASGAKKPPSTTQKSAQNPNSDRSANVPVFSLESECASRGFSSQSLLGSGNLNFSVSGHGGRGGGRRGCDYRKEENDRRSHGSSSPSVWGSGSPNFSVGGHTGRGGYDDQTEENDKGSMNEVGWNNSRGGIGGNGAQRGESRRIDALSRLMSSVLRHRADKLNLNIRSDGYVAVKDLLNMNIKTRTGIPLHCYTVDDFKEVVKRDNKQRFGLLEENNVLLMRANQGHSMKLIDSEGLLKPIVSAEEVPVCVHGTYLKDLESIKKSGLSRMKRNHVHFARGLSTDNGVISGMRSDCEVMIYLDVQKALQDGMKLYVSENGVILTEGFNGFVPPKYFTKIETVEQKRKKRKAEN